LQRTPLRASCCRNSRPSSRIKVRSLSRSMSWIVHAVGLLRPTTDLSFLINRERGHATGARFC
jgi:hypothetical protein